MKFIPILCVATGLLGGAAQASTTNLITNGDFELGNIGFGSDFTFQLLNIVPAKTYTVTTNPNINNSFAFSYGDNTTGAGNMMAINGTTTPGDVFWRQTVAVTTGTDYLFSLFTSTWAGNTASLALDIGGVDFGTFGTPSTRGTWVETVFAPWSSGNATSVTLELANLSGQFTGNDFALDDLSFASTSVAPPAAVIPLPAAGWALITALAALVGLRRRARA